MKIKFHFENVLSNKIIDPFNKI